MITPRIAARGIRPLSGVLVVVVLAACSTSAGRHSAAGGKTGTTRTTRTTTASKAGPTVLQASVVANLPAPVSRAVVVADGDQLVVLGGLTAGSSSAAGVYRVDPSTGALRHLGDLAVATHDAAGARVGRAWLVFGGGEAKTIATVQSFDDAGAGRVVGRLPTSRSDLVSASIGDRVYLLGGYDGSRPVADVLGTSDGVHFDVVARLPDPVRYPAVAVVGSRIYLFGGEGTGGATSDIQEIDPASRGARVVGHLPEARSHAAAAIVGGQVVVLGGRVGGSPSGEMLRFDPAHAAVARAGTLPEAVADAGVAVIGATAYLVGGEGSGRLATLVAVRFASTPSSSSAAPPARSFAGRLLIADRGNNRLLVVDPAKHVLWTYPSATAPPPPGGFYFPDDAFFAAGGHSIIINQEGNDTIVRLAFPSGAVQWSYGHAHVPGAGPGYLAQPDDAYLLKDGRVTVADARNCRILFIDPASGGTSHIGTTGRCRHGPPAFIGYPNGDTPLANGNVLVSEIDGSFVTELTPVGGVVWSLHLSHVRYPSDPQQIGPDLYLVADFSRPGGIYEFTREGRLVYSYRPSSGDGMLDHPSLAELLPNGLLAANDDHRHRVVLIDPTTQQIVWQYGQTDVAGTGPNQLDTPDGFDLLDPAGATPTHPQTG